MALFAHVAGFYAHYADEAPPAAVAQWNVRPLALPRESRHNDASLSLELFARLDAFLAARRSGCKLAY